MFVDSSDHLVKLKNHAGTVVAIGGSSGLADSGANGIVKRTDVNTTAPAVAGTDYYAPGGTIAASDLPFPGASAKGAILTTACTGGQVVTGYKPDGTPSCATISASGFNPLDTTQKWIAEPFCDSKVTSGYIGASGWTMAGTFSYPSSTAGYPCQALITTAAATANSIGYVWLGGDVTQELPDVGFSTAVNYGSVFKFKTPASLAEIKLKIGFKNSSTDAETGFVGVRYTNSTGCTSGNATDSTWMYETASSSATTSAGPAIAANTWYTLSISNGATAGQVTMKMATAGGAWSTPVTMTQTLITTPMVPVFHVVTCTTSTNSVGINYFGYLQTGLPQ
jgi:hypothetical protein